MSKAQSAITEDYLIHREFQMIGSATGVSVFRLDIGALSRVWVTLRDDGTNSVSADWQLRETRFEGGMDRFNLDFLLALIGEHELAIRYREQARLATETLRNN